MTDNALALLPGEHMVLSSRPHWWYFWKHGLGLVAVIVAAWLGTAASVSWIHDSLQWLASVGFLVWLVLAVFRYAQWRTTRFAVTDKRVAYQVGLISRKGVSIPLNRVNNVNYFQGALARVLGNGTIVIESAGESGDTVFENIPHPESVRQVIFQTMEQDETVDATRDAQAVAEALRSSTPPPATAATPAAAPAATPPSTQARLQQLEQLRSQGLLSPEEYTAKRAEILRDL